MIAKFAEQLDDKLSSLRVGLSRIVRAPLRKVVSREMEVFEYFRNSERPRLFVIRDLMECGHVFACLGWEYADLVNGYSDNPEVTASRHRCHPCAALTKKKPQSVKTLAVRERQAGDVTSLVG